MNCQPKSVERSFHKIKLLTRRLACVLVATLFSLLLGAGPVFANFARVGAVPLNSGENNPQSAVIDPVGGFAYFGLVTSPGTVVKVRLSDFTRVGALTLNPSEDGLGSAVIDQAGGFAYFITTNSPGIVVKVRLSDFTRVGALSMSAGEGFLTSAAIDPVGGFAYFGNNTNPGIVVKVRLSDFTRVGALTLNSGETQLKSAVIDSAGGFAYFGTYTSPGIVVKVRLSDFTRVGAQALNSGENKLSSGVIDPAAGFAYFGTDTNPGIVVKVRLSDFTRAGVLNLNAGEGDFESAVIDPSGGFGYFGTSISPGKVVKIRLSDFTRVGALSLNSGENFLNSAVIDPASGFAYFGAETSPGIVVKIDISPPPPPTVSINDVSQPEGNASTTPFNFTITLSAASAQTVSVNYTTADNTAQAGSDYQATSGVLTFAPGEVSKQVTVLVNGDMQIEPNETFLVTLFNPISVSIAKAIGVGTIINDDNVAAPTIQFSSSFYTINEGDPNGRVNITLTRAGDTTSSASVNYATNDAAGLQNCNVFNGVASPRCDYENTIGTATWAAGDATSKTFSIAIVDDSYAEGTETFTIGLNSPGGATLGAQSTATVTITDNDATNGPNPIDNTNFFVRQQYLDFLGREPDPPGFAGWTATINNCAQGDTNCDRIHVSQLFFQSVEFQQRGYFVYRFYPVAFGRKPDYSEFVPDLASVSGFLDANQLEAAKVAFIAGFMARPAFANAYNGLTNQQYVDMLLNMAGVTLSSRQAMIDGLNNATLTRAAVLRQIVESTEVSTQYNHQAYAVMEYFGYLRRQPDGFYLQWIAVLDATNDPRGMVTGFVNSSEYRSRFGP
jgi:Calx-beta domain-containing protein